MHSAPFAAAAGLPGLIGSAGPAGRADRPAAAWHADSARLARFITDLVADEIAHLRPGGVALPAPPWALDLAWDDTGLGLDSLERMSVAAALNEALHLHASGLEDLLLARHTLGGWVEVAAAALRQVDARISFRTSGSSGMPKACEHGLDTLQQEVDHLAGLLAGSRRILSAVPAHHIYGFLFTVLLPARLGGLEVIDVRRATPQALARMLRPADLLVSHPAHWALVARHAGALPSGVVGVTSTAPCPDAVAQALAQGGLQRLVQVYGSSETAGVGWRDAAGAPYQLMPFWSRGADGDPDLCTPAGAAAAALADAARSATVLQRMSPDGSVHAQALQDRLAWRPDGRFQVTGRLDAAVQVGGTNVFPARVRQVLLAHPQVADAAVRLMAAGEGDRLKAFIVPRPGADAAGLPAALGAWVQDKLSAVERPKSWTLGGQLPVSDRGKTMDWPLDGATPAAVAAPARSMQA